MSHDDFESPNKSNEKKEFRHLSSSDNMDQRRFGHQEYDLRSKPKKSNATAIALAVVASLLVCGIGYELVQHNVILNIGAGGQNERSQPAKKKSILLKGPKEAANGALFATAEDDEDYHLNLLKEQNWQQSAKIKALRQELLERMHSVHDIKANLFKYNRTHDDKVFIGDLQRDLLAKIQLNDHLKHNISSVEHEAAELEKKITQLEVTRDTLMGMLEKQQLNHRQEISTLKNQINDLTSPSKAGLADLEKRAQTLEVAQQQLTDSLLKKNAELESLQKDLASHQRLLTSKTAELELLLQKHDESRAEIRDNTIDLVANIEFEFAAKEIAKRDFLKALSEKTKSIEELKREIVLHQKRGDSGQELISEQEKEFNNKSRNLIWAIELEALRNEHFQHEHYKTVRHQNDKLKASEQKIVQLQKSLDQHASKVVLADEQIAGLSDLHTYHRQLADTQLQNISSSHEVESTKALLLSNKLQDVFSKIKELEVDKEEIQKSTYQTLLHNDLLSRQLAEKEQQLLDHQLQWQTLTAAHKNGQQQAAEQARRLVDLIETDRLQSQKLSDELAQAQKKYFAQEELANLLGSYLEAITQESAQLEGILLVSKEQLEAKEKELQRSETDFRSELTEKELQLTAHKQQLQALNDVYQNGQQQAGERAGKLADVIETERLQQQQLKNELAAVIVNERQQKKMLTEELALAQQEFGSQEELANVLGARLEELALEAGRLEEALLATQALLESKHHEKQRLEEDLINAQNGSASQEELASLLGTRLEEIVQETSQLEEALLTSKELAESKHNELQHIKADLSSKLAEKEWQLEQREDDLAQVRREHQEALDQLEGQQKLYSAERDRVKYLESDLVDYLQQISGLETSIDFITDEFESEKDLRSRLENELIQERQLNEQLMTEYTATKAHFEQLSKQFEYDNENSSTADL